MNICGHLKRYLSYSLRGNEGRGSEVRAELVRFDGSSDFIKIDVEQEIRDLEETIKWLKKAQYIIAKKELEEGD